MAQRKPDRQLRKIVTQLRKMPSEDRVAILDLLHTASRLRVESLLRNTDTQPSSALTVTFAKAGYSPWLLARLEAHEFGKAPMTMATAEMLRECARVRLEETEPAPTSPRIAKEKQWWRPLRIGSQAA
ncbi:MAG TPA: hypothetical protein VGE05_11305 [Novosphingobium sp.]